MADDDALEGQGRERILKTVAISLPYGVNLRNFFLTEWGSTLLSDPEIRLVCVTGENVKLPPECSQYRDRIRLEVLRQPPPSRQEKWFNLFQQLAFLPYSKYLEYCFAPSLERRPWVRSLMRVVWDTGLYRTGWFKAAMVAVRRWWFYEPGYEHIFRDGGADLAVATRLFNTDEWRFLEAARRCGVKTAATISSWDNLHSYGYLPFRADCVIVWNSLMADEARLKHGIDADRIRIAAPAQFDLYFRPSDLEGRDRYFSGIGLDPSKKLVTFTTADILGDQPAVAELVYQTVVAEYLDRQMLVRIHPQEDPEPYRRLANGQAKLVVQIPGKSVPGVADRVFSGSDLKDLACLMRYSDVVINVCSTITLDASVADTPVICYRSLSGYSNRQEIQRIIAAHDQTHFRPLLDGGALLIADNETALRSQVDSIMGDRQFERQKREIARKLMAPTADGQSGRNLAALILELSEDRR